MKTLAEWQQHHMSIRTNLIVVAGRGWPYRRELKHMDLPYRLIEVSTPRGGAGLLYLELTQVWRKITSVLREPALAHYHNAWMSGALTTEHDKTPSVVTFHGVPQAEYFDEHPGRAALHRHFAARTLQSGAALVSVDADAPRRARNLLGIPAEKFSVVPNGVYDTTYRGCPRLRGENVMTVGVLGTLDENKGWRIAAQAVAKLAQSGSNIRLFIAGPGVREAQIEAGQYCQAIGHGSRYFGLLEQPRDNFIPFIDVLIVASRTEGSPMSVLECLAAGVPVVSTRVGGLAEILEHGFNALFVGRDCPQIAVAIQELGNDPALHARLSRHARRTYEQKGTVAQMANKYQELYHRAAPNVFHA